MYVPGALPPSAAAAGAAGGVPCAVIVEGQLPQRAPCSHTRDHCLLAPHCGWCESTAKCVAADEEGVCFGNCPGGQLLYTSGTPTGDAPAEEVDGFAGLVSQVRE